MLLKVTIIITFIAIVLSLGSGLMFLLKDITTSESKRTLYALGLRLILALLLIGQLVYGFYSGKLGNTAPWGQIDRSNSLEIDK